HDLGSMPARGFQNADGADHVHVGVVPGPLDRDPHVGLRREMENGGRPQGVEDGVRIADVGGMERRPGGHVLSPSLREIVEHMHLVAAREQRLDDMRADEACPPGDDRPHGARILGVVGALVAIEGIDGAGKGTQAARVAETAAGRGHRVASFGFPLYEVEYGEFALPRPALVVLLDAPVALARELVGRKAVRGYTTLEADIHESDAGHSGATREVYLELAERDDWRIVAAAGGDGTPR